ncbi:MAG TPA: putative quinol monooxygenase [Azospirillum sp.]|nr:putative quinol monooxygenase [Azospirillum sp.]
MAGSGPVVFIVSLHVKAGCEDEFQRLLVPVLDAMRHEATFINTVLHQDPADPARFMLYETWADLDDVAEVQMKRAYRSAYEARLPDLLREPRQVQVWRPLRGDFTAFAGRTNPAQPTGVVSAGGTAGMP